MIEITPPRPARGHRRRSRRRDPADHELAFVGAAEVAFPREGGVGSGKLRPQHGCRAAGSRHPVAAGAAGPARRRSGHPDAGRTRLGQGYRDPVGQGAAARGAAPARRPSRRRPNSSSRRSAMATCTSSTSASLSGSRTTLLSSLVTYSRLAMPRAALTGTTPGRPMCFAHQRTWAVRVARRGGRTASPGFEHLPTIRGSQDIAMPRIKRLEGGETGLSGGKKVSRDARWRHLSPSVCKRSVVPVRHK